MSFSLLVLPCVSPAPHARPVRIFHETLCLCLAGDGGVGTFFEGAITAGYASDATDEAVHASVVSAGYMNVAAD